MEKMLKKQSARAKEKLLESLGKADRTTDDIFEEHSNNFAKQQKSSERFVKDLKNYVTCMKSVMQASRTLHETIREVYESEWPNREHVLAMSQSCDLIWDDYLDGLNEKVLNPYVGYVAQFADVKTKIAKRGRKLVDYDSARHNLHTQRASSKRGDDDPKVTKANAEFLNAEKLYKDMNDELLDEMPTLYDSRIAFMLDGLRALFNSENKFHGEAAKLNAGLYDELDALSDAMGSLRVSRPTAANNRRESGCSPASTASRKSINDTADAGDHSAKKEAPTRPHLYPQVSQGSNGDAGKNPFDESDNSSGDSRRGSKDQPVIVEEKPIAKERAIDKKAASPPIADASQNTTTVKAPVVVVDGTTNVDEKPNKILYKVKATHKYTAEDTDELSFDGGELISVVQPDDPDDLDEGWLMGIRQSDGMKGVFPANFTRPL